MADRVNHEDVMRYLDGEASPEVRQRIEQEIETSTELHREVQVYQSLREELRKLERAARDRRAFTEAALLRRAERMAKESPASLDLRQHSLEALRRCVEKLAEKGRQLLGWFYEEGLSSGEIAEKIGAGGSAVRNALVKLRLSLRKCVQAEMEAQES